MNITHEGISINLDDGTEVKLKERDVLKFLDAKIKFLKEYKAELIRRKSVTVFPDSYTKKYIQGKSFFEWFIQKYRCKRISTTDRDKFLIEYMEKYEDVEFNARFFNSTLPNNVTSKLVRFGSVVKNGYVIED